MDIDELSEHAAEFVSLDLKRRGEEFMARLKTAHPERWAAIEAAKNAPPDNRPLF